MDWQQVVSICIVALSASLIAVRQVRKHRRAKSRPCGHDCGCAQTGSSYSDKITFKLKEDSARGGTP